MDDRRHTLRRYAVVATSSLEEARAAVTDVYLPHALEAANGGLRMQLNAARQKRFTLGFLAYGADAELQMPPTRSATSRRSRRCGRHGRPRQLLSAGPKSGVGLITPASRWLPAGYRAAHNGGRTR